MDGKDNLDHAEHCTEATNGNDNDTHDTGARQKTMTERGIQNQLRLLKNKLTSSLAAVTKCRNVLSKQMTDNNNLHLVKTGQETFDQANEQYIDTFTSYHDELEDEEEKDKELNKFESKQHSILEYRKQLSEWIYQAERQLSIQLDHMSDQRSNSSRTSHRTTSSRSSKHSRYSKTSSKAESSVSVRAREKAKLAELLIEKSVIVKRQSLQAQEEQLKLEIEIAKTRAREQIYADEEPDVETIINRSNKYEADASDANTQQSPSSNSVHFKPALEQPGQTTDNHLHPVTNTSHTTVPASVTPIKTEDNILKHVTVDAHSDKIKHLEHPRHGSCSMETQPSNQTLQSGDLLQSLTAVMALPQPQVPKFKGDPIEYRSFMMSFDARIASHVTKTSDLLYYLDQHLCEEPRELIGGCLHMESSEGYKNARRLLEEQYGNPYVISTAYINKALTWPTIKADNTAELKHFSLYLIKCLNAMQSIGHMSALNHPFNLQAIVQKLPLYLHNKWRDNVTKLRKYHGKIADFGDLSEFVTTAAESANDPIYSRKALGTHNQFGTVKSGRNIRQQTSTSFATTADVPQPKSQKECVMCSGEHDTEECQQFLSKNVEERRNYLKEKHLCFGCYGANHSSRFCRQKRICRICEKRHPTGLHIDNFNLSMLQNSMSQMDNNKTNKSEPRSVNPPIEIQESVCSATNLQEPTIMHSILPVRVTQKGTNKTVLTYAFLDNGSSGCFVTNELLQDLSAESNPVILQLKTLHGKTYINSSVTYGLVIADSEGHNPTDLPKCYSRDEIPVSTRQIPRPEIVSHWQHLKEISHKIPKFKENLNIGLLIGNNCPAALEPLHVVPCYGNGPFATQYRHGWTINGPLEIHSESKPHSISCNRIAIQETHYHKEVISPEALLNIFEQDFRDCKIITNPDQRGYSQEDIKFLEKVGTCKLLPNGHYEIPLPFRHSNIYMPNNREQALRRLNWQRKKMERQPQYHRDYTNFMNDLLSNGYACKVPQNQNDVADECIWYLPHHAVYHPKKPNKICMVFDCSASYCGTSLNDQLLQGPNLTNSLVSVLIKFRQHHVALMGDIEAMFHQVRVPTSQRNFLRFLWWPNGDLQHPVEEFQMAVHLFGAISSPSVCNFALRKTAEDNSKFFTGSTCNTIQNNFYVDDCLCSVKTESDASQLIHDLQNLCAKGGFHLTKFISSSETVMQDIPNKELSKEMQAHNFCYDNVIERALGVTWFVHSDVFGFKITINNKPFTRRGVLSIVSSVYDPLGFLAPIILPVKRLLQELCIDKHLGWDDEIPTEHHTRWSKWLKDLPELEHLSVQRCITAADLGQVTSQELHIFSDASSSGYGSVAYMRYTNSKGQHNVTFMMGKSRVQPTKMVTIPKLELTAATLSIRLGQLLLTALDDAPKSVTYHTDSTTVLKYITNDKKRYPVFVANRVQTIRDFSQPCQWRYVDTKNNPADDASRGLEIPVFMSNCRWLEGPDFLQQQKSMWPLQPVFDKKPISDECYNEDTIQASLTLCDESKNMVNKLMEYHSDWTKLQRTVAVFLHMKDILRSKSSKRHVKSDLDGSQYMLTSDLTHFCINTAELERAEIAILKFLQFQHFEEELSILNTRNDKSLQSQELIRSWGNKQNIKKSPLYRLDPFLNPDGILCVGGRISKACIPQTSKHPVILPSKCHVTELIIRSVHKKLGHAGRNHVLSTIREKYWILRANIAVRHVLFHCVICRRMQRPPEEQKMADLPADRLTVAPPFTFTGVDYFGPYYIKENRKELKRYGVLFSCLNSRAIHIETAVSLTTSSFIQALRRFVARRGNVKEMRSDNGTNFVGAERELKDAIQEMKHLPIEQRLSDYGIKWTFNTPAASHMGGAWERQIRSVRKILSSILCDIHNLAPMDDESLRTYFCEVEAIINSRPLTNVSNDPKDINPLTPNDILTLKGQAVVPPPGNFQRNDIYLKKRWRRVQYLAELFWSRWKREYLVSLQPRQKWNVPRRNLQINDIVLIKDDNSSRNVWPMGCVVSAHADRNGFVRSVTLKTQSGQLCRPVNKLVLLVPNDN